MFLFRRRKESVENPVDELKLEEIEKPEKPVAAARPVKSDGKDKKEKAVKKAESGKAGKTEKDPFFQSEDSLQIIENDTPVKVVIPASSLIEDEIVEPPKAKEPEPVGEPVPEEVVDGLFVKVNEGKDLEEEEVPLDSILPPIEKKTGVKQSEQPPVQPAADKVPPAAPAQPVQPVKNEKAGQESAPTLATAKTSEAKEGPPQPLTEGKVTAANAGQPQTATAGDKPSAANQGQTESAANEKAASGAADAKKPAAAGDEAKKNGGEENKENLFSQLFGKVEEIEETPLDRLIKVLPEISMDEVLNEAEEVKGLMSEWFQNQSK
jgi:hypothetical protein